jgi:hypothetical protein
MPEDEITVSLEELDPALVYQHPVLDADGQPDQVATAELAGFHAKMVEALKAAPNGPLTREHLIAHGFGAADWPRMVELNQRRLIPPPTRPYSGNRQARRNAERQARKRKP